MTFTARIPGSRSITARALVCAALGSQPALVTDAAECDDAWAIADCLTTLGAQMEGHADRYTVSPSRELRGGTLNCRASGTTFRFMSAMTLLTTADVTLTGTPRLLDRPIEPLLDVLRKCGKRATVTPSGVLIGGTATIPDDICVDAGTSGQFVSGLMMALGALSRTTVIRAHQPRSIPFIQMTANVMGQFGQRVEMTQSGDDLALRVPGGGYTATRFTVEPDVMSANYLLAAAVITGRPVTVEGIPSTTCQGDVGMIELLAQTGASVTWGADSVTVRHDNPIGGMTADLREMPDMSLTLAVIAAVAQEPSTFTGVANLRYKESDRLAVLANELTKLGCLVNISADDDTIRIVPLTGTPPAVAIETYDDHRVAMAFGLLTLRNPDVQILDPSCVNKTWPGYFDELKRYSTAS